MSDIRIQNYKFRVEPVSRLSVLQVEPRELSFDQDDSSKRSQVFAEILSWLSGRPEELERLPRPQLPRLVAFPELYTPYETVFDLVEYRGQRLHGEQIVTTGLATSSTKSAAAPFFDAEALEALLAHPAAASIKNMKYVDRLRERLRQHGMCANLAASIVTDASEKRQMLIHSKAIPSKYEQRHRYDRNTIEGDELQTITFEWKGGCFTVLPLICSDFSYRHEALRHSLLHKLVQERIDVNLLCVLSVQACFEDGHPPWPREYQLPTLEIAEQRFSTCLDEAHTMLTNVGGFVLDAKSHTAGYSFLSLQNGRPWPPHVPPTAWDGITWYFGKLEPDAGSRLPHTYAWVRAHSNSLSPSGRLTKHIAGLLTHEKVESVDAVLQHFEISAGSIGQDAWQAGRLIAFRCGKPLEQL